MVFLGILVLNAGLVGLSLGVLLPSLFPGACLGASLAMLVCVIFGIWNAYLFPVAGGVLALLLSIASAKYVSRQHFEKWPLTPCVRRSSFDSTVCFGLAMALEGGAVVSCIAMRSTFPLLKDLARGYPYFAPEDASGVKSAQEDFLQMLVWAASIFLVAGSIAYRDGNFGSFNISNFCRRNGYEHIQESNAVPPSRRKSSPHLAAPNGRAVPSNVYNMFDPADLPPRLAEYANMVYSACEDLGNFFGFQDSSVRNQAEHLLILLSNNRRYMSSHILPPSVQPPSPIHALHAKVFSNYVKWCRAMGVNPYFSKMNTSMNAPPAVASRVVDLVLFFCVWGEAANLRHMAECIWFLYHKMMQEYVQSEGYTQTRSLYAGHFLDTVVTPIFVVVRDVRSIHK